MEQVSPRTRGMYVELCNQAIEVDVQDVSDCCSCATPTPTPTPTCTGSPIWEVTYRDCMNVNAASIVINAGAKVWPSEVFIQGGGGVCYRVHSVTDVNCDGQGVLQTVPFLFRADIITSNLFPPNSTDNCDHAPCYEFTPIPAPTLPPETPGAPPATAAPSDPSGTPAPGSTPAPGEGEGEGEGDGKGEDPGTDGEGGGTGGGTGPGEGEGEGPGTDGEGGEREGEGDGDGDGDDEGDDKDCCEFKCDSIVSDTNPEWQDNGASDGVIKIAVNSKLINPSSKIGLPLASQYTIADPCHKKSSESWLNNSGQGFGYSTGPLQSTFKSKIAGKNVSSWYFGRYKSDGSYEGANFSTANYSGKTFFFGGDEGGEDAPSCTTSYGMSCDPNTGVIDTKDPYCVTDFSTICSFIKDSTDSTKNKCSAHAISLYEYTSPVSTFSNLAQFGSTITAVVNIGAKENCDIQQLLLARSQLTQHLTKFLGCSNGCLTGGPDSSTDRDDISNCDCDKLSSWFKEVMVLVNDVYACVANNKVIRQNPPFPPSQTVEPYRASDVIQGFGLSVCDWSNPNNCQCQGFKFRSFGGGECEEGECPEYNNSVALTGKLVDCYSI